MNTNTIAVLFFTTLGVLPQPQTPAPAKQGGLSQEYNYVQPSVDPSWRIEWTRLHCEEMKP